MLIDQEQSNMMNDKCFFVTDFLEISKEKKLVFEIYSASHSRVILDKLFHKFFNESVFMKTSIEIPLWQFLKDNICVGVHLPNAASKRSYFIEKFFFEDEVYFIFDLEYCENVFRFRSMADLAEILKDAYNFNFYIFDKNYKSLIAWDKDETLFGSGKAVDWVKIINEDFNKNIF